MSDKYIEDKTNKVEVDVEVTSKSGGRAVLPPWGFAAEGPRFAAFYAKRWGGADYPGGALFTLRSLDDRRLEESGRVRIFHGFGAATIRWKGEKHRVPRERIIGPGH